MLENDMIVGECDATLEFVRSSSSNRCALIVF